LLGLVLLTLPLSWSCSMATTDLAQRVLTVPEAAELMRIGVRTYYSAAARGEVPVRRIGRRLVVPGAELARFLAGEGERKW
jgi:excisionase family DNA binding protein